MTRHHATFSDKARDAVGYMITIFVFLPGVLGIIGLVSGMRVSLLVGLLTIYYLVAAVVALLGGLTWLERHLS